MWRVLPDPDGGWFAALVDDEGKPLWRSLTTKNRAKADRWCDQAACHGADAHDEACSHCEPEPVADPAPSPFFGDWNFYCYTRYLDRLYGVR